MTSSNLKDIRSTVHGTDNGALVQIQVSPGAKDTRLKTVNIWRKRLEVAVRAQPKKGEANKEVVELMANVLGVPRARVSIVSGDTGSKKTVKVEGLGSDEIVSAIARGLDGLEGTPK